MKLASEANLEGGSILQATRTNYIFCIINPPFRGQWRHSICDHTVWANFLLTEFEHNSWAASDTSFHLQWDSHALLVA